jgi:hypothetical protein
MCVECDQKYNFDVMSRTYIFLLSVVAVIIFHSCKSKIVAGEYASTDLTGLERYQLAKKDILSTNAQLLLNADSTFLYMACSNHSGKWTANDDTLRLNIDSTWIVIDDSVKIGNDTWQEEFVSKGRYIETTDTIIVDGVKKPIYIRMRLTN